VQAAHLRDLPTDTLVPWKNWCVSSSWVCSMPPESPMTWACETNIQHRLRTSLAPDAHMKFQA
jgi:hypothetical protein